MLQTLIYLSFTQLQNIVQNNVLYSRNLTASKLVQCLQIRDEASHLLFETTPTSVSKALRFDLSTFTPPNVVDLDGYVDVQIQDIVCPTFVEICFANHRWNSIRCYCPFCGGEETTCNLWKEAGRKRANRLRQLQPILKRRKNPASVNTTPAQHQQAAAKKETVTQIWTTPEH